MRSDWIWWQTTRICTRKHTNSLTYWTRFWHGTGSCKPMTFLSLLSIARSWGVVPRNTTQLRKPNICSTEPEQQSPQIPQDPTGTSWFHALSLLRRGKNMSTILLHDSENHLIACNSCNLLWICAGFKLVKRRGPERWDPEIERLWDMRLGP